MALTGIVGGQKKFRKRTLIERLKGDRTNLKIVNEALVQRLQLVIRVLKMFESEENWACSTITLEKVGEDAIMWVGEGEPNEIAKATLLALRKGINDDRGPDSDNAAGAPGEVGSSGSEPAKSKEVLNTSCFSGVTSHEGDEHE